MLLSTGALLYCSMPSFFLLDAGAVLYWISLSILLLLPSSQYRDRDRLSLVVDFFEPSRYSIAIGFDDFFNIMLNDKLTYCIVLSCIAYYSYPKVFLVMVFLILKK